MEKMPPGQMKIARLLERPDAEIRKHGGESVVFIWADGEKTYFHFDPHFEEREQALLLGELKPALFTPGNKLNALQREKVM
jgi:hypothetical protein